MRIVFVMDPVSSVLVDEDTSYALMREAERRGHQVDHCLPSDVGMRGDQPFARVRKVHCDDSARPPILLGEPETMALAEVDAVFVRKDPPFDDDYHWLSLLLEKLSGRTLVVNSPLGLREANEKLYACHFPDLTPDTLVSRRPPHRHGASLHPRGDRRRQAHPDHGRRDPRRHRAHPPGR